MSRPSPTRVLVLMSLAGLSSLAGAAPTITLSSATGNTCVYSGLTTDATGNITVTCASQPDGVMVVTPARIVEGAAAAIHLDCGSNTTNSLYLTATNSGSDVTSWTNGTVAVLNCTTATKTNDLTYTAARNGTADPDRVVALTLSTAASGGGTVKATSALTVTDDLAVLNALTAPMVWANTSTAMTAAGTLGVTAAPGSAQGTYGDLYVDATGKWTYVLVPSRAVVPAGSTVTDTFTNVGGTGKTVTVTVVGSDAGTPAAPTIGTASRASSTSISVGFTAASSGPAATGYQAECASSDGGATGTATATGAPSSITVGSLTTAKTYTCRVRASNASGYSSYSASSSPAIVLTADQLVPNAPTIGTLTKTNTTTISVAFTPSGTGPAATGYNAVCDDATGGGGAQGTGSHTASPIPVASLTTNKTYHCKVRATNASGASDYSSYSANLLLDSTSCSNSFIEGTDATWDVANWPTSTLYPGGPSATISASGSAGKAIRFVATGGGSNGVTSAGVSMKLYPVSGTVEALVSACPHDFTTPAYGTIGAAQCYWATGSVNGSARTLTFNGTSPTGGECALTNGQTYYINFRQYQGTGTVTARYQITAL